MERIYFDTRKQMTDGANQLVAEFGYEMVRCRLKCCGNNKRNGILILNGDKIEARLIRCKTYKMEGGCNGKH